MKNKFLAISLLCSVYLNAEVLVFSKAYALALENAHSLKSSVFQVEAAKERIEQEKAMLYPQINLSGYYKRSENTYPDSSRDKLEQGLFNYGVTLKQSLYNAEIYSRIDLETSKNELYKIGVELDKEELAQTVFIAYLEVLKGHNKINLFKSYLKYAESRLDELNKKYDMFMVSKMDLLELEVEYKSAQIDLNKERKILKVYELKLQQLIGTQKYELPKINSDTLLIQSLEALNESVTGKSDFSSNLQLLKSKLEYKVSKLETDNAFNGHYPRLDLDAAMHAYDTDTPDVQAPYKDTKSIMLILNIPIYSGGSVSSRVRESELASKSVHELFFHTQKEIQVRYDEYLALFEASSASVSMYKDAYDSSLLYVDSVEKGYEHGLKSIIDLNDAKNKQYEVRYKYIENIYAMVDSYIGLLIVTNNFESIELLDKLVEQ